MRHGSSVEIGVGRGNLQEFAMGVCSYTDSESISETG